MLIIRSVDQLRQEMHTTADGPITLADIREHLTEEYRGKGLACRQLIDASGATIAFSPSDVRATVAILKRYGQEGVIGPTAIVVGNEFAYGMCRMLAILLDGVCELEPFRTNQEAERWLADAHCSLGRSR